VGKSALPLVKIQTEEVLHPLQKEMVNMFNTDGSNTGMQPIVNPLAFLVLHHPVSFQEYTNTTW
jgi:hypothetical protein